MKELRLKLRFLTPAFIGGPDGNAAELRPPSVKGMLRFWWRAVNAGNFGLNELKINEARIFGDASGNGRVSSFLLNVKSSNLNNYVSKESFPKKDYAVYSIKGHRLNILEYLAYGTYSYDKMQRRNVFEREYIRPGLGFELILSLPDKTESKGIIQELYSALVAWSCFGGLGSKSRNGFGSFTVENAEGHPQLAELMQLSPAHYFNKLLSNAKLPEFTAFSKKARLFKTGQIFSFWDACLAKLGHIYREARLSLENKHSYDLRQFIGAPIVVNKKQYSLLNRRAKPYFLRVHREKNGYVGYILYLPSHYYLSDSSSLQQRGSFDKEALSDKFQRTCEIFNNYLSDQLEEVK